MRPRKRERPARLKDFVSSFYLDSKMDVRWAGNIQTLPARLNWRDQRWLPVTNSFRCLNAE
jgi:hypothetical protein